MIDVGNHHTTKESHTHNFCNIIVVAMGIKYTLVVIQYCPKTTQGLLLILAYYITYPISFTNHSPKDREAIAEAM